MTLVTVSPRPLSRPGSWEGEVETGALATFLRRCGRGEEAGARHILGVGLPRVRQREKSWKSWLLAWTAHFLV